MIAFVDLKIILPGGAGLVGQNLVARLKQRGQTNIVVLDKHPDNVSIMRQLHPDITIQLIDLSKRGAWEDHFIGADVVVMLQAQIGGLEAGEFFDNNVASTRLVLNAMKENQVPQLIHVSSSVVMSSAEDDYTKTKKLQEQMVRDADIPGAILRPTLMFGWFDRKHLGWLARFMDRVPIFPIPGDGKYMRQPLYAGDFGNIIISCIENKVRAGVFNISGQQRINYIDIIRQIKKAANAKARIVKIPYGLFFALLWIWEKFDKNPPFTTHQLQALEASEEFEVIDWPKIFSVRATPFADAIEETFTHPTYSKVILGF